MSVNDSMFTVCLSVTHLLLMSCLVAQKVKLYILVGHQEVRLVCKNFMAKCWFVLSLLGRVQIVCIWSS